MLNVFFPFKEAVYAYPPALFESLTFEDSADANKEN